MTNDKEFETPQTVDVNKLAAEAAKKAVEEMMKNQTPAAKPTALTEDVKEKKEDPNAYRKPLLEKHQQPKIISALSFHLTPSVS